MMVGVKGGGEGQDILFHILHTTGVTSLIDYINKLH